MLVQNMDGLEDLPAGCPPCGAKDIELTGVYRVVTCADPTEDEFKSHAARKLRLRPPATPCEWASCSLFGSRDKAVDIAGKLPKPRFSNPHLAVLNIDLGDGKSLVNARSTHIHFWAAEGFDPLGAVVEVEKVDGD